MTMDYTEIGLKYLERIPGYGFYPSMVIPVSKLNNELIKNLVKVNRQVMECYGRLENQDYERNNFFLSYIII